MNEKHTILVVDDDEIALDNLIHILEKEGYEVTGLNDGAEALQSLGKNRFDLILTDLKMREVGGMEVLKHSKNLHPDTEVILVTGFAAVNSAIEAMKLGAYHYLSKPYIPDEVRRVVREALEKVRLKQENQHLHESIRIMKGEGGIITNSPAMRKILHTSLQVAASDSNVVLTGESGTGKELFARYIHSHSRRKDGPMISVNCGAFSEDLLGNELFGHAKGAFTGADSPKIGLIEKADGGTLFLDEVTEMSMNMQVKLLRVLQEKEVLRLGENRPVSVDVRFIAATNRNLQEEVRENHFRQDLFFRINVVAITLPPLVERKSDIPLLIQHFIEKYNGAMRKEITGVSPEVTDILMHYDFPGNIRELENIIERGVALATGSVIEARELPQDLRGMLLKTYRRKEDGSIPSLEEHEKSYIQWVLEEVGGNKTQAAQYLGIDRVSLWRKLKRYNLQ